MAGQSLPTSGHRTVSSNYYLGKLPVNPSLRPNTWPPLLSQWCSLAGQICSCCSPVVSVRPRSTCTLHARGTWHSYSPGDRLWVFISSYAILPINCGTPTIQNSPATCKWTLKVEFYLWQFTLLARKLHFGWLSPVPWRLITAVRRSLHSMTVTSSCYSHQDLEQIQVHFTWSSVLPYCPLKPSWRVLLSNTEKYCH